LGRNSKERKAGERERNVHQWLLLTGVTFLSAVIHLVVVLSVLLYGLYSDLYFVTVMYLQVYFYNGIYYTISSFD